MSQVVDSEVGGSVSKPAGRDTVYNYIAWNTSTERDSPDTKCFTRSVQIFFVFALASCF